MVDTVLATFKGYKLKINYFEKERIFVINVKTYVNFDKFIRSKILDRRES